MVTILTNTRLLALQREAAQLPVLMSGSTPTNQPQPTLTNLAQQPAPDLNIAQSTAFNSSTDIFQELASESSFSTSDPENPLQLPTVSNSLLQGSSSSPLLPPHSSLLQPPPFLLQPDSSMWEGGGLLGSTYQDKLEPFHNETKVIEPSYADSFETGNHEEETMEVAENKVPGPMSSLMM